MTERITFNCILIIESDNADGFPVTIARVSQNLTQREIKHATPWNTDTPFVIELKIP